LADIFTSMEIVEILEQTVGGKKITPTKQIKLGRK
jgi:hypothetical protein